MYSKGGPTLASQLFRRTMNSLLACKRKKNKNQRKVMMHAAAGHAVVLRCDKSSV